MKLNGGAEQSGTEMCQESRVSISETWDREPNVKYLDHEKDYGWVCTHTPIWIQHASTSAFRVTILKFRALLQFRLVF
jgi:hypothetical protein